MLRATCCTVVTTIPGGRCSLGPAGPRVVRTIALEEDAPMNLFIGGDDDPAEEDARIELVRSVVTTIQVIGSRMTEKKAVPIARTQKRAFAGKVTVVIWAFLPFGGNLKQILPPSRARLKSDVLALFSRKACRFLTALPFPGHFPEKSCKRQGVSFYSEKSVFSVQKCSKNT